MNLKQSQVTPKNFISNLSSQYAGGGSYTVAPVIKGNCLDFPFHLKRLKDSYCEICNENSISNSVVVQSVLKELSNMRFDSTSNGFLTIAMVKSNAMGVKSITNNDVSPFEIKNLFSDNLKNPFLENQNPSSSTSILSAPTEVETFSFKRNNPGSKDIKWPNERLFIEQQRQLQNSAEIILKDNNNVYLEGLTSNFFVMNSNAKVLYTSFGSSNILEGSMSRLLHNFCRYDVKCKELDIRIENTLPITNDLISTCDTAFLTSATKPVFPLSGLYDFHSASLRNTDRKVGDIILKQKFEFKYSKLLHTLRYLFIEDMKSYLPQNSNPNIKADQFKKHTYTSQSYDNYCNDNDLVHQSLSYPMWWPLHTMDNTDTEIISGTRKLVDAIKIII